MEDSGTPFFIRSSIAWFAELPARGIIQGESICKQKKMNTSDFLQENGY